MNIKINEMLRLVSSPRRMEGLDSKFGFEVSSVKGFGGETLIVDLNDYELLDRELNVYRLNDSHSHNKYR